MAFKARPYIIITHHITPKKGTRTQVAGYSNRDNTLVKEQVEFADRLKDRDRIRASVIIDVFSRKVLKNRFNEDMNDDALFAHYAEKYNGQLVKFLGHFLNQHGSKALDDAPGLPELPEVHERPEAAERIPVDVTLVAGEVAVHD